MLGIRVGWGVDALQKAKAKAQAAALLSCEK